MCRGRIAERSYWLVNKYMEIVDYSVDEKISLVVQRFLPKIGTLWYPVK